MNATKDTYTELADIVEIRELTATQDVNLHIRQGWKIINTYKSTGINNEETLTYCVGRTAQSPLVSKREPLRRKQSEKKKSAVYSIL